MALAGLINRFYGALTLDTFTKTIVADKLTYLSAKKLHRLHNALKRTRSVGGDIVEFGIALGGSGIILARNKEASRRFLGFDVFGMIPPPTSEKDDARSKGRYKTIQSGAATGIAGDTYYGYKENLFSQVKAAFARHGAPVDGENIALYRGLFEETWPTVTVHSVALAHVDCDWYDPVRYCLHALAGKLSEGGIIIIDDYYDYGGCRTAVDEFLEENKQFAFEDGPNPYLCKRRS